jgi:CheY-like chemotaxis protein
LRWLAGDVPNLAEAREAIRRIMRDGHRAGEVTRRIRALFTKTRVAKEDEGLRTQALEGGAGAVLIKPFSEEALLNAVNAAVSL